MNDFFRHTNWRFIDQSLSMMTRSPLESFAMDDTLCHLTGHGQSLPVIRTWVHNEAVVLGIQDHRLPYIEDGMNLLRQAGYDPIVRNSGGLAVVLDPGVLNISIVFGETEPTSIDQAFSYMVGLVRGIFPEVANEIEVYEIVGSYCPGTYDLSIGGRKFAGISQRRMQNGIAVQIYLCIEGSGSARAALIRDFYSESLQGEKTKFHYPVVVPEVMASMQELVNADLTVAEVNMRIQRLLLEWNSAIQLLPLQEEELSYYTHYLERVFKRNASLLKKEEN
ncbi:lipoate--protein ligase family protein [Lysinibacillus odysseyi]|uniref:Octanoyl-[GcvH]:protein N-octanoyltransferase n=1 Tax=Lysinibacillus odysseyi 34hs-1 = NBRC 100172 TaxID=1220589 RepID=A0A0A3ILU3_9BACI|nr:lipoate--protein ligase family protein [Lysinibacillus odysseyi]KGR85739.1 octanoyltransferase [Lysinibacillus odysseyi 34hs-1 = NBRC 100172]